jgi:hypothetical protein
MSGLSRRFMRRAVVTAARRRSGWRRPRRRPRQARPTVRSGGGGGWWCPGYCWNFRSVRSVVDFPNGTTWSGRLSGRAIAAPQRTSMVPGSGRRRPITSAPRPNSERCSTPCMSRSPRDSVAWRAPCSPDQTHSSPRHAYGVADTAERYSASVRSQLRRSTAWMRSSRRCRGSSSTRGRSRRRWVRCRASSSSPIHPRRRSFTFICAVTRRYSAHERWNWRANAECGYSTGSSRAWSPTSPSSS